MKKYMKFTMLLLTILFTLTACQGAKDDENQNLEIPNTETAADDLQADADAVSTSDTQKEEAPEADLVVLTEEELDWFENSFFNTEENPIVNMFLTSKYEYAEEVDLYQLFYNGIEVAGSSEVSDEERQLLKDQYDVMDLDIFKVTTEEMDAILQKYMGITLEKSHKVHLDSLYYLEEYDAYYGVAGDTNYMQYTFDYGWKQENGTVAIEYSCGEELRCVTLKAVDGGYYFLSNGTVK